jgi:hypothetical protein
MEMLKDSGKAQAICPRSHLHHFIIVFSLDARHTSPGK